MNDMQIRNSSLDIARVLAIFLVVILHISESAWCSSRLLSGGFGALSFCCINIFGLLSGYLGAGRKHRLSSLALLWLQVWFYSFGITLICYLAHIPGVSKIPLLTSSFPFLGGAYWYFTAYVALFFIMPILDKGLLTLSRRMRWQVIIAGAVILSVLMGFRSWKWDVLGLQNGYTFVWLAYLYFLGGGISKNCSECGCGKPYVWLALYGVSALAFWGIRCVTAQYPVLHTFNAFCGSYSALPVLLCGVFLFLFCLSVHPSGLFQRILGWCAPAAFGVYLIHVHPLVYTHFSKRYVEISSNPVIGSAQFVFLAVIIFLVCVLIDRMRLYLFELLKIKQRLAWLGELWKTE